MPTPRATQETRSAESPTRCTALTTSGAACKRLAVAGLLVCKSHGGGTAASVRAGKRAGVSRQAAQLWGISPDAGSDLSIEDELRKLARNKLTDVLALRLKLGVESDSHIGLLVESTHYQEYDIEGTVQSKSGSQKSRVKRSGTSPWVQELHKTEMELIQVLKLLHEVTGGSDEVDLTRIRLQTAREAARIMKSFPGITVDEVAREVSRRG